MTAVVKTKLIFLDSDSVVENDGIGHSFNVQVPSGQLQAGDGQFLRISLQNFNMIKNFYNINESNNGWVITSRNSFLLMDNQDPPQPVYKRYTKCSVLLFWRQEEPSLCLPIGGRNYK